MTEAEIVLAGTRRLWDMTDRLSGVLIQARHDFDIDFARRDERQKLALLQRILNGNLLPSEVSHLGSAYGLEPDSEHWVFRARHPEGTTQSLSRHIELTCGGQYSPPLVGPIDGDLAGITCRRPSVNDGVTVLAVPTPPAFATRCRPASTWPRRSMPRRPRSEHGSASSPARKDWAPR